MSDDPFRSDDVDRPSHSGEQFRFGDAGQPWFTPPAYDGNEGIPPAPRRAELLGDGEGAWWADVAAWTEWAIGTFRLTKWLPPCWPRHSALVEEAQSLWLMWCAGWMGTDPNAPAAFLNTLATSLQRIETTWQIPCTATDHTEPTPVRASQRHRPLTTTWWSNADFDPDPAADWP